MNDFWARFEAIVARRPDSVGLIVEGAVPREFTYREVHAAAEAFARRLAAQGLRRGQACALLGENSAEWIVACLALHRLNAIAVPLDAALAPETIARLLADSGAVLIACPASKEAAASAAAGSACRVMPFAGEDAAIALPPHAVDPEATAMLLYTSGTAGDPKGVVLTHANIAAAIDGMVERLSISETDSALGVLPLFHILAQVSSLFLPFSAGAKLVLLEEISATEVVRVLKARRITILCCVPQFFYLIHDRIRSEIARMSAPQRAAVGAMLAVSGFARGRLKVNAGRVLFGRVHDGLGGALRLFVSAGAAFDPAVARSLDRLGFTVVQAYGLTETTGAATLNLLGDNRIGTVGTAMPGMTVSVLDSDGRSAPPGEEGEVAIRGAMVSPGYHGRPDLTAGSRRAGWFMTGDRGRLDPAGHLSITGRDKDMIVLDSGKKVFPEDIERILDRSPYIAESCVLGRKVERGGMQSEILHALIVPDMDALRRDQIVNVGDNIRHEVAVLCAALPAHQRIMGFDVVGEPLPRTSTRKIRRFLVRDRIGTGTAQALPERPRWSEADRAWAAAPPASKVLPVIREAAPLPVAEVHPDDSLELDLGLDSLRRVELIIAIEQALGVHLPPGAGVECYTVRELVDAAGRGEPRESGEGEAWPALLALDASTSGELVPSGPGRVFGVLRRAGLGLIAGAARLGTGSRLEGRDLLPPPPFILCPNHQSYLDGFLILSALPPRVADRLVLLGHSKYFGARKALAGRLNVAVIDPDANLVSAMRTAAAVLVSGHPLLLFPEGERTFDGEVARLRRGAAILSIARQVPIVPLVIEGPWQMWPREHRFQGFRPVTMRVLQPLVPPVANGSFDLAAAELTERLEQALRDELARIRAAP